MFITKKALNEKIAKAVEAEKERMYFYERIGRVEEELNRRIDRIAEAVCKLERMHEVCDAPEPECNPPKVGY